MIIPLMAEDLNTVLQTSSFDLTYSVNAMDHAHDPLKGLLAMLAVTKPCRWGVMELWEKEADMEQGWGMHKWNFVYDEQSKGMFLKAYGSEVGENLTQRLISAGAMEVHAQRWNGCYLNGDCNNRHKTRVRLSFRKAGGDTQCG